MRKSKFVFLLWEIFIKNIHKSFFEFNLDNLFSQREFTIDYLYFFNESINFSIFCPSVFGEILKGGQKLEIFICNGLSFVQKIMFPEHF